MKRIFYLTAIILSLLVGCNTKKQQQAMQSWIGSNKAEIIQSWGPPQGGYTSDGQGGEILLYNSNRTVYAPISGMVVQRDIQNYTQVYCRSDGTIYYLRWGSQ